MLITNVIEQHEFHFSNSVLLSCSIAPKLGKKIDRFLSPPHVAVKESNRWIQEIVRTKDMSKPN